MTTLSVVTCTLHMHVNLELFIPVDLTLMMCPTSCLSRHPFPSRSYTLKDHFSLSVNLPRRTRFTAATNSMKSIWPSWWEETESCQSSILNTCPCTAEDLILNWLSTCSKFSFPPTDLDQLCMDEMGEMEESQTRKIQSLFSVTLPC